eukprot:544807-Pelagomonas_calceolata.AAC.1
MGIRRVIGSTGLHNLAARSILVFNSTVTSSGNKLVGIDDRMGMKLASKLYGMTRFSPNCAYYYS